MSDQRAETITVNAAGLVQGIALVTFPAASGIFTAHAAYDLSSSQYGIMFAQQRPGRGDGIPAIRPARWSM